jgi:hypothetical protein
MSEQPEIGQGDTVRVLAEGQFNGQEVKVLEYAPKTFKGKTRKWYLLDVTWDGEPRPSWFERDEIERIEAREEQP